MKKNKFSKVLVLMLTAIMASIMVACGSADNSKTVAESFTETPKEDESISESKEIGNEEEEVQPATAELSDEEVIAIAEDGFRAIKELNPEEMIKRTNMELLYYMGNPEKADDEELLEVITTMVNNKTEDYNSLGIVGTYYAMENVEFYDVERISEEELIELNNAVSGGEMPMFKENQDYQYIIEDAYELQMNYDVMEEGKNSYMLIVYANGQWKLDVIVAVWRDVYQMVLEKKPEE